MNIFKKAQQATTEAAQPKKTTAQIIEEIHDTFYTEVDRILADAKVMRSTDTQKSELIEKGKRLKALGFTASKEALDAQTEIDRIEAIVKMNEEKKGIQEAVDYFSFKYPNYKFITEKSVKKICDKYGLVYGSVTKYKGTVPDKNLEHIEKFKIDEQDCAYNEYMSTTIGWSDKSKPIVGHEKAQRQKEAIKEWPFNLEPSWYSGPFYEKCSLEIAAPVIDFDMRNMEVTDYRITNIPDPVVLHPVFFKGRRDYLIVTAWGEEASDEMVVNQKMN